jgi:hypothetical protein
VKWAVEARCERCSPKSTFTDVSCGLVDHALLVNDPVISEADHDVRVMEGRQQSCDEVWLPGIVIVQDPDYVCPRCCYRSFVRKTGSELSFGRKEADAIVVE